MNNKQMATLGVLSPFVILAGMAAIYGIYLLVKKNKKTDAEKQ